MFAKPAVGVLDFLSNTATGIRNTTTLFEGGAIERVRQPRFIASDGVLRPYSEREALGQSWLHSLGFRYEREVYVAHLVLGGDDDTAVILTEARILLIQSVRLRVIWDVPLACVEAGLRKTWAEASADARTALQRAQDHLDGAQGLAAGPAV